MRIIKSQDAGYFYRDGEWVIIIGTFTKIRNVFFS